MKTGVELIADERQRQIEVEGWTPEHDGQHDKSELSEAAACYAISANEFDAKRHPAGSQIHTPAAWPWDAEHWKPGKWWTPEGRIRMLVKAGALIAAEIDRVQTRQTGGKQS
jgi:hypothetical protein